MTTLLKLQISLEVGQPKADDEYQLHIVSSNSTVVCGSYPFEHGKRRHKIIEVPLRPQQGVYPDRLWFYFYIWSDSDDTDGLYSETPEGWGYLSLLDVIQNEGQSVSIKDCDDHEQAIVTATWIPEPSSPSDRVALKRVWQHGIVSPRDADVYKIDDRLVAGLTPLYTELRSNPETQRFFTWSSPLGYLPVITFPILLTNAFYEPDNHPNHPLSLNLITHLTRLSCASLGMSLVYVARQGEYNDAEMAELVGEVLGWIPRCLLYVADFERGRGRGKGDNIPTDCWSMLWTFPRLGKAGADCEDVNGMVIQLVDRIQALSGWASRVGRVANGDPAFNATMAISRFLGKYTCGLGLGSLHVARNKYEAHAHPIIIDRRAVQELITKPLPGVITARMPYLPSIVVEGTNWCASAWDAQAMDQESDQEQNPEFERCEQFFHARGAIRRREEVWLRRVMRGKMPAYTMMSTEAYGTLTAVLFPQHQASLSTPFKPRALHLVLRHATEAMMGVPTNDFLLHKCRPDNVIIHADLDLAYIQHVKAALSDFPVSQIPLCETLQRRDSEVMASRLASQRAACTRAGLACLSVRTQDYKTKGDDIRKLVHKFQSDKGRTVEPLNVRVTDDCQCTEVYV